MNQLVMAYEEIKILEKLACDIGNDWLLWPWRTKL